MSTNNQQNRAIDPLLLGHILNEEYEDANISEWTVHDYKDVIVMLRDKKGLTFREITKTLGDYGIKTNRTTVYDIYKFALGESSDDEVIVDQETGEVVE